jgi:hypothetical protein
MLTDVREAEIMDILEELEEDGYKILGLHKVIPKIINSLKDEIAKNKNS